MEILNENETMEEVATKDGVDRNYTRTYTVHLTNEELLKEKEGYRKQIETATEKLNSVEATLTKVAEVTNDIK